MTRMLVVFLCLTLALLLTGCESESQQADALYDRGRDSHEKGNYDKAIAEYTAAIQLDPEHALALIDRGTAWVAQGEFDKAIADCDEALRLRPGEATRARTRELPS